MPYDNDRYEFQSAELSKLDYSGRSRIRIKLTSTPELLNTPDTPATKWLSVSADTARAVADAITNGARDDVHRITDPEQAEGTDETAEDTPRGVTVNVIRLGTKHTSHPANLGTLRLPEVPRNGDIVFVGMRECIVERAQWGAYDDLTEVNIQVREL